MLVLLSLYALLLLEGVALSISLVLAVAKPGLVQRATRIVARRKHVAQVIPLTAETVYAALAAFAYTAWSFACVTVVLCREGQGYYTGLSGDKSGVSIFWQSLYYSSTTVGNLGSDISPIRFLSELARLLEGFIGIFFFLFLLATLIARYLDKLHSTER